MADEIPQRPAVWAVRFGRGLLGVPVSLHWLLILAPPILFVAWVADCQKLGEQPLYGELLGHALLQTCILTVFVYLHELGHALAALRSGTPVPEIVLHPLGGAALLGARMRSANQELVVAGAGPAVSLVLMGLFWALLDLAGLDVALARWTGSDLPGSCLWWAFYVNAVGGVGSLLPIFPLDGAGVLRAFLSFRLNPNRATHVVATLGLVLCVPLAGVGLYLAVHHAMWGSLLIVVALWGLAKCYEERLIAREFGVYESGAGEWRGAEEFGDRPDVRSVPEFPAAGPARPGFFARWMERRRRRRAAQAAQAERAFQAQVDELLAKVKREGLAALTRSERRVLEEASQRLRRRGPPPSSGA
jgi:Zn-dependent protease